MTYLLDAMEFLKTEDLKGWKELFDPPHTDVCSVQKRLRQSPAAAPFTPFPLCEGCGSDAIIDDVPLGQHVCTHCGLILRQGVFTGDIVHCSMDQLMNGTRVYIHRYSRVVHFKTTIRFMEGNSSPQIDDETVSRMQAELVGPVTVEKVSRVLRKLGLARKYRRHRWKIANLLGMPNFPELDSTVYYDMLKMFRRFEFYWNFHHNTIAPGRRVFLSYCFLFYQFAHALGHPEVTGPHHLLKNAKLSKFQFDSYRRASEWTGFKVFE